MIKTPICDLLGIEYPIFQGGMAWISDGKLAAAVSNGGGLGIISAMNANAEYLKKQIDLARSLTDKPFGVNIMLMSPFAEEVAQLVAQEKVAVVTTGAGNPSRYMPMWLEAGIKVIPVVASVGMAKLVTKAGAAAIIAEGGESGGHVGDLTTMVLVPQVCDATPLPVLAAGGIGDGRGVAAAFMLGHPVRQIKNQFAKDYAKAEYSQISDEELEKMGSGALYRAAVLGDEKTGDFLAGQIAGMVNKEQPAAEIIKEMFTQAEEVLKGADKWVK